MDLDPEVTALAKRIEDTATGITLQIRDAYIVHDPTRAAGIAIEAERLLIQHYGNQPEMLARMFVHLCVKAAAAGFNQWNEDAA